MINPPNRSQTYYAFGLTLQSPIPLTGVSPPSQPGPRVVIRYGNVAACPQKRVYAPRISYWADRDSIRLEYERIGRLEIRAGREIVLEPGPDGDEQIFRLIVMGPAMALLLHQRGMLVLHASSIAWNGQAVAFLGGKGWGKSSLAAALCDQGGRLVSDDVLPLVMEPPQPLAVPGFPHIKIWPQAAAILGQDPDTLTQLHPALEKRARIDTRRLAGEPLPLAGVYVLEDNARFEIQRLSSQEAFVELVRHSYACRFASLLADTGSTQAHFDHCVALIRQEPVFRLVKKASLTSLPELAAMVGSHLDTQIPSSR